ncbi:hypothetical protein [Methylobacterium sp. 37f]|uniref:hypothetical protein n=1 Tax=Methylobacterium sp. 37f TaxID=2817058 RepID=UPI001FFC865A|nr:hypothetical protein [Methylobacterium sp. 37f]MCK2056991.1 hypothetical protein [Methylobacterium sp. 37f]
MAASNILVTDEEREILAQVEKREREKKAERDAARQRLLDKFEERRDAQNAADREACAKPAQILARQIGAGFAHYELHRLIQDLAKTNQAQLVAELQQVWQRDEDQRMAGKLAKPLLSAKQAELDAGVL